MPGLASASDFPEFIESTSTGGIAHIEDESLAIWNRFGVTQQRTYVFVSDDGNFRQGGYGNLAADVQALIDS